MTKSLFPSLACLAALMVSACGGGGNNPPLAAGSPEYCASSGREADPFAPGACRDVFRCLENQREVASQVCECAAGTEGDSCRTQAEYQRSMGLSQIGHQAAVRLGLTGDGVTVGFFDNPNGVTYLSDESGAVATVTHPDLPSIRVLFEDPNHPRRLGYPANPHAIWVAGVMAARADGRGVRGVAPDASYFFAPPYYYAEQMSAMISLGARVVNNSFGSAPDEDWQAPLAGLPEEARRRGYLAALARLQPGLADAVAQADAHRADRAIVVYAAGNAPGPLSGEMLAGLPHYLPELRGHVLAVGNVVSVAGATGLAHRGSRCGAGSASYCLVAPSNTGYFLGDGKLVKTNGGTSFSAPLVSGALALMKEYFDRLGGLGGHELVKRMLSAANKTGQYADESIYGAGLLDLENALSPQGEMRLLSGESVWDGEGVLLSESEFFSGLALGDSAGRALRGMTLAAFDDLHAPFPISSEMVLRGSSRARLGGLGSHLRRWQVGDAGSGAFSFSAFRDGAAWWSLNAPGDSHFDWDEGSFGGEDSPAVFSDWVGNPYSGLAGRGLVAGSSFRLSGGSGFRMAMFGESLGNEKRVRGVLAEFSFSPFSDGSDVDGGSRWFAQAGGVREYSGLLASSGSGLFSDLSSRTAFAGLGFAGGFSDGWRYRLGAHWGRTSADGGAWLTATDSLRSGSYAAGLERANVLRSGDGLGFRVRQPLRVSGGLKFRVPTGRTKYGELTWSEVSGTPSGRELEWEARYRRPYDGGHWGVSAVLVSESGHRSGAKTEGRALFAFERAF